MPISSVLSVAAVAVAAAVVTELAVVDVGEVETGEIVRTGLLHPSRSMTRLHSRLSHE